MVPDRRGEDCLDAPISGFPAFVPAATGQVVEMVGNGDNRGLVSNGGEAGTSSQSQGDSISQQQFTEIYSSPFRVAMKAVRLTSGSKPAKQEDKRQAEKGQMLQIAQSCVSILFIT